MSLNVVYAIREGFKGLRRARVASFVTISTIAVTLTLLDLFLILTVNVQKIIRTFKSQIYLEVFIDNSLPPEAIEELGKHLLRVEGIQKAVYISPEMALERFRKEFGEDPLPLLGENPLPPSFRVFLKPDFRSPDRVDAIAGRIRSVSSVDEVSYHGQFFRWVERTSRTVLWIDLGLLAAVVLATLYLVNNTLRLTLLAQNKSLQIMRLVGATAGFIRRPYLFQGIYQGALGGIFSSLFVTGLVKFITWRFSLHLEGMSVFFWGPVLIGGILGFWGSLLGLRRYQKD